MLLNCMCNLKTQLKNVGYESVRNPRLYIVLPTALSDWWDVKLQKAAEIAKFQDVQFPSHTTINAKS